MTGASWKGWMWEKGKVGKMIDKWIDILWKSLKLIGWCGRGCAKL
jgi:hypothetical protein